MRLELVADVVAVAVPWDDPRVPGAGAVLANLLDANQCVHIVARADTVDGNTRLQSQPCTSWHLYADALLMKSPRTKPLRVVVNGLDITCAISLGACPQCSLCAASMMALIAPELVGDGPCENFIHTSEAYPTWPCRC